ncbi:P-loop containing nucleoside triphosphate hydrolase protein [Lineolata rhizophorae]|uniref:P-loop containing nucleoside triphosphate hydrolase protein n=1 Tax=Lineolata rhizophorae TaxID=578093 RepID=A0A6A6NME3_9PEZI|nr:P-loop containing nucleoside triphosphate hydrolase protein [Lineolata rhizophorae]
MAGEHSDLNSDDTETAGSPHPLATDSATNAEIKELLALINRLEQLQIERTVLPLPKIVVVGDQSAGKSSLVEAISEIKVPRAAGTCTRCPLQIKLARSPNQAASWQAEVSLHRTYDYNKSPRERSKYSKHWELRDQPVSIKLCSVSDRDDLEDVIVRAQAATLNPSVDPHVFMQPGADIAYSETKFSPNVVCINVEAPGLPELSFYDLPGIINQARHGEEYLVHTVRRMASEYMQDEKTIIMLACAMEGDIQNCTAASLVTNVGATRRCIGVLTKPDRIPAGDPVDQWEEVLNGRKFGLGYSYFVTKQPSTEDLNAGISHQRAREAERVFFATKEPWATRFSQYKERFGTHNLQDRLSELLAKQIFDALPDIANKVEAKIKEIEAKLACLPGPPRNAYHTVHHTIYEFSRYIADGIDKQEGSFRRAWKIIMRAFRDTDLGLAQPLLKPITTAEFEEHKEIKNQLPITIDDEDDEGEVNKRQPITPSNKNPRKRPANGNGRPLSTPTTNNNGFDGRVIAGPKMPGEALGIPISCKIFTLEEIKEKLNDFADIALPREVNRGAVRSLMGDAYSYVNAPIDRFLLRLRYELNDLLDDAFSRTFDRWRSTHLWKNSGTFLKDDVVEGYVKRQAEFAALLGRMTTAKPVTGNDHIFSILKNEALAILHDKRFEQRAELHLDRAELYGKAIKDKESKIKKKDPKFVEELGSDPEEDQVQVMAEIRAFYISASSRFADYVQESVECEVFDDLKTTIAGKLQGALGLDGTNEDIQRCEELLAEDPQREYERRHYKAELESVQKAREHLAALMNRYGIFGQVNVDLEHVDIPVV